MIVVRKIFMSLVWFVVFFAFMVIGIGIYVSMSLDLSDPNSSVVAEAIGNEIGQKYAGVLILVPAVLAIVGSIAGILPGSRHNHDGGKDSGTGGMIIRKILASLFWVFILYIGTLILGGMIAGGIAGANDPTNSAAAGAAAGEAFALQYGTLVLYAALAAGILGSVFGILPFSKHRKADHQQEASARIND